MKQFVGRLLVFALLLITSVYSLSCSSKESERLPAEAFMGDEKDAIAFLDNNSNQIL